MGLASGKSGTVETKVGSSWVRGEFGLVGECCGVWSEMVEKGDMCGSRPAGYIIRKQE